MAVIPPSSSERVNQTITQRTVKAHSKSTHGALFEKMDATRSQLLSLLSRVRLNRASSLILLAICNRIRIAQTALSFSGGFSDRLPACHNKFLAKFLQQLTD
jgi:hypothetical protein